MTVPVTVTVTLTVTVPEDAQPGAVLECTAPDGQELIIILPESVLPGSVLTLSQDPVTKAWKCVCHD